MVSLLSTGRGLKLPGNIHLTLFDSLTYPILNISVKYGFMKILTEFFFKAEYIYNHLTL